MIFGPGLGGGGGRGGANGHRKLSSTCTALNFIKAIVNNFVNYISYTNGETSRT